MIRTFSYDLLVFLLRARSTTAALLKAHFNSVRSLMLLVIGLLMSTTVFSQLPTASQVAANMKVGWNLGNTLEAIGGETNWGNPQANQQLMNGVKAAGFNTVRLPISWDQYADPNTHQIDAAWMSRVKQVVDYCINSNLYVIINIHWDNGWLENNVTTAQQQVVNEKQQAYWTQIANNFKNYDEHLLFASANEPDAENATEMSVLLSYHQTFVNAVRATGGNNSSRTLIVQGPRTDIGMTNDLMNTLPADQISNRMMVEVHYYDPYQFCLMSEDASWGNMFYYWGNGYHSTVNTSRNADWGEESHVDERFALMKSKFIDNGIPVIIGEFSATRRSGIPEESLHLASRRYYHKYVVQSAVSHGIIPVYWDHGGIESALFDRSTGNVVDQGNVDAIMEGVGASCTPSEITPYVQVNGGSWIQTSSGTLDAGGSIKFGPWPTQGGSWSWSGPNSFSANTREVTISNIQPSQAGDYVATYTNAQGCNSTHTFKVTVNGGTGGGSGTILREYWTGVSGTAISNLTSSSNYPNNPSGSEQLSSLEGPTNWGSNYGTRIRGYIHPATSGSYTFWIAGDDNTELYLGTDDNPGNKSRIAYVSGWTNPRQWTKYNTQQSASITLNAGQKYYVEVLHKEGSGGDNVAVAWQGPGISQQVIAGSYLSPYNAAGIVIRARGTKGDETIDLQVGGQTVATWTLTTSYANYTASGEGAVSVHFTNDNGGRDVQIDYVTIGGTTYQSENQSTNTGVWQNSSCGGSNSEWLHCAGYISYATSGGLSARVVQPESGKLTEADVAASGIVIYPNPSLEGNFSITIPKTMENATIGVFDNKGRLVHKKVVTASGTLNLKTQLREGVYLVTVTSEKVNYTKKLVVR
ncbi:cellulase family glycosylhydrolase [Fulvivirga sp. 29W222]|uniref:Cellulase family glycosylhydrolase n=1 Tax=Fulvivirga marina TaxID=2494733 RepID=A0A937KEE4_9BACT|nr:cellulase family glycosylhydrolase [Fulvivirga marina]MBL6449657.1 cellulase family glycosylhydrolase [Fulvivirga marina]